MKLYDVSLVSQLLGKKSFKYMVIKTLASWTKSLLLNKLLVFLPFHQTERPECSLTIYNRWILLIYVILLLNLGMHSQNKFIIHLFWRILCLLLMLHFCAEHCEHAHCLLSLNVCSTLLSVSVFIVIIYSCKCCSFHLVSCFYGTECWFLNLQPCI